MAAWQHWPRAITASIRVSPWDGSKCRCAHCAVRSSSCSEAESLLRRLAPRSFRRPELATPTSTPRRPCSCRHQGGRSPSSRVIDPHWWCMSGRATSMSGAPFLK
eukprot:scaffold126014_cov35-Tisochrysis_lutea.AAC.2